MKLTIEELKIAIMCIQEALPILFSDKQEIDKNGAIWKLQKQLKHLEDKQNDK